MDCILWIMSRDQVHGPFTSVAAVEEALPSVCLAGDRYRVLLVVDDEAHTAQMIREATYLDQ